MSCPAGSYCPGGTGSTAHACPEGYYCPAGSFHPTPCPKGTYCGLSTSAPVVCSAGYYCPPRSYIQKPCSPGYYCPQGTDTQLQCTGNLYSASTATVCSCIGPPNGRSQTISGNCFVTCNTSFMFYQGLCFPSSRPARLMYINSDGSISNSPTQNIVYSCPPCYSIRGSFCSFDTLCRPTCPPGYIIDMHAQCIPCPPGQQSLDNSCVPVDAGYYAVLGIEKACPPGTYAQPGGQSCSLCPRGTYSSNVGATSSSTCLSCPAGTFSNVQGAAQCTVCQDGTYSTLTGQTSYTVCQTCTPCPLGTYGGISCLPWRNSGSCTDCPIPLGTAYVTALCTQTVPTLFGQRTTCTAGTFLTNFSRGTYSTLGSAGTCQACAAGQYSGTDASLCTACPIGQFNPNQGSNVCYLCSVGTYADTVGSTSCTACSLGTFANTTNSSQCTLCSAGTFANTTGSSQCTRCSVGTYAGTTGMSQCISCLAGSYANTPGSVSCTYCPSGMYQASAGQASCNVCATGTYQNLTGQTNCISCLAGSYANTTGMSQCTLCSAGTYQNLTGKLACNVCVSGTYSNTTGSTQCSPCSNVVAGQYVTNVCTTTQDTRISSLSCGPGYSGPVGSSQGSWNTLGVRGTCTACSTNGSSNCGSCTQTSPTFPYWSGSTCVQCITNQNCGLGSYCTSAGSCAGCVNNGSAVCTGVSTYASLPNGRENITVDSSGNLYVADAGNNKILIVNTAGVVSPYAGTGQQSSTNGPRASATFDSPRGLAFDSAGNLYISEMSNKIRKIDTSGDVSTYAGSGGYGAVDGIWSAATFRYPRGVAVDSAGNVYVADTNNHCIRKIDNTVNRNVSIYAGIPGTYGYADGIWSAATFKNPERVAADSAGNVYVADTGNNIIRKIDTSRNVSTMTSAKSPKGIAVDSAGNVYVADTGNNKILKVDTSGIVSTIAGSGAYGTADGLGTSATFMFPQGVTVDSGGNVYVVQANSSGLRKIS